MATQSLLALDDETWGERVARARARARLSLKEAAARVSQLIPVSYSTLMRLESLDEAPTDLKRRAIAYLALFTYGYKPETFGLSVDDLPRRIKKEMVEALRSDLLITQKPCFAVDAA